MLVAKMTVRTVKCTGTDRNFFSVTVNYLSAVFFVYLKSSYLILAETLTATEYL